MYKRQHDQPRSINKYIQAPAYRNAIGAKALALLYFNLRGCPFIYQGQELGVTNAHRESISTFNDLSSHDNYDRAIEEGYSKEAALEFVNARSRDNARLPYPWDNSINHGFNSGAKPWIALDQKDTNVNWQSEQLDSHSVWHFYQAMIKLRQSSNLSHDLIEGDFQPLTSSCEQVIAYQRGQHVQVYVNLSEKQLNLTLPNGKLRLNNYEHYQKNTLIPYQAILFEVNSNE